MPIIFEAGIVHECDDCGCKFSDQKNQLSILNNDRCLTCQAINEALNECTKDIEVPEETEEYATA